MSIKIFFLITFNPNAQDFQNHSVNEKILNLLNVFVDDSDICFKNDQMSIIITTAKTAIIIIII